MNLQEKSFNALVSLVKLFPEVGFVGSCFGGLAGPCIATAKPWPETLRKEAMTRFPEIEEIKSIEISVNG